MLRVTLPNGKEVKRGDAILVEDGGYIATAFVDKIDQSEGYPFVSAAIIDTTRNSMDTGQNNPVIKALPSAVGARHVSTPDNIPGIRFCLIDAEEETLLRAHHNKIGHPELIERPVEEAVTDTAPLEQPETVTVAPGDVGKLEDVFDPADKNQDGVVTKQEKKQFNKENN
jgi:hypothetical protein